MCILTERFSNTLFPNEVLEMGVTVTAWKRKQQFVGVNRAMKNIVAY